MSTREELALQREKLKQSGSERRELLKLAGQLTKLQVEAINESLGESAKTQRALVQERAKRGSQFSKLASAYDTSRDAGATAARVRAAVALRELQVNAPIEFAKAAYLPDVTLLENIQKIVPAADNETLSGDLKKRAWQEFVKSSRAMASGNILGTWGEMVRIYGEPNGVYFGPTEGNLSRLWQDIQDRKDLADTNAQEFAQSLQGFGESWSRYIERTGKDPEDNATMDSFLRDTKFDVNQLPGAESEYVQNLKRVAANPAAHPEVFSDIDEMLEKEQGRSASLRMEQQQILRDAQGDPAKPSVDDSLQAKLAAWVRRPDVQWWAKEHGFNLGNAIEVTPEIQAEIDAGRYPGSMVINGMLYNPSPDDMRALRFADAQLRRDPQKNLLYAAGLTRDERGPRRIVEVEVVDEQAPNLRAVRHGVHDDGEIKRLSDGSYIASADGVDWKPIPEPAGAALMAQSTAEDIDEPVESGAPKTRTVRMEARGPQFGKDPVGSVRGVDLETGEMVVIPQEKIARKTFIGADNSPRTLGERANAASARATAKREGLDLSTEAQNEEDIGEKPTAAQKKASKENQEQRSTVPRVAADRAQPDPDEKQLPAVKPPPTYIANAERDAAVAAWQEAEATPRATPQRAAYAPPKLAPRKEMGASVEVPLAPAPQTAKDGAQARQPSQIDPVGDVRYNPPPAGTTQTFDVAPSTKAPEVTTPTAATTPENMDAQRRIFQRARNTGGGAASGMVQ